MRQTIIEFAPDGGIKITTKGFAGKACKDATRDLETALGLVASDRDTPEMRLSPNVDDRIKH